MADVPAASGDGTCVGGGSAAGGDGRRSPGGGGAGGKGLLRRHRRSAGAGNDSSGGGSAGEPAGSGADLRGGAAVRGGGCCASHPGEPHAPFFAHGRGGGHCGAVAGQHEEPAGAGDPDHRGIGRVLQGAAADAGRRCGRRRGRCYRRNGTGHRRVLCRCPHYPHPGTTAAYDVLFGGGGHGGCHAAPARAGDRRQGGQPGGDVAFDGLTGVVYRLPDTVRGRQYLGGRPDGAGDPLRRRGHAGGGTHPLRCGGQCAGRGGCGEKRYRRIRPAGGAGGVSGTLCTSGGAVSFV